MFRKFLFIMTLLNLSVNALADDHGSTPALAPPKATGKYVNQWIPFPGIAVKDLITAEPVAKTAEKGRIQVVVFIASWCIPCQQIIDDFTRLETKHQKKYTNLLFVFAHDSEADAVAFAKQYKIEDRSYLGTAKILEDFHQPELPSVYASDRFGWLAYRKLNVKKSDIAELDTFITKHSSF
ncbi:MAG: redoxin domain-containing protein [Bdellovibrionota bacterium]